MIQRSRGVKRILGSIALAVILVLVFAATFVHADDRATNLLKHPDVHWRTNKDAKRSPADFQVLLDGAVKTSLPIAVDRETTLLFRVGEKTVTIEQACVQLDPRHKANGPRLRIEVLASMTSHETGFRLLRADIAKNTQRRQSFSFTPAGAKWIMIRLAAAVGKENQSAPVQVGELEVIGRLGPPKSRYAFNESPVEALKIVSKLDQTLAVSLSADEASLLADAADGKLDRWSLAEAALVASGINHRRKRQDYLHRLAKWEEQARREIEGRKSPLQKGEALLKWLHQNVFKGGYRSKQTSVAVVLDQGTYNCVSSALVYNIFGRRLGLDLRAIEVPDHAFSILYDKAKYADVETTSPDGFNPSRDPSARRRFEKLTGFRYIPDRHRDRRREVGELGLTALVYYNHGVQLSKDKKYAAALSAYFRALRLDREFASATHNVLAVLANWCNELSNDKQFEKAVEIGRIGLDLAPNDAALINNYKVAWTNWSSALIDQGRLDQALQILRRAEETTGDENFQRMQSWVYIQSGKELITQRRWRDALSMAETGLTKIDRQGRDELQKWRVHVLLRWFSDAMDQQDFQIAHTALLEGMELHPSERRFPQNFGYLAQEWSWQAFQKSDQNGYDSAATIIQNLQAKTTGAAAKSVESAARNFVVRAVKQLLANKHYMQAVEAAVNCREFIKDDKHIHKMISFVHQEWAASHIAKKDWRAALQVYRTATPQIEKTPNAGKLVAALKRDQANVWNRWGHERLSQKDWAGAADVYQQALQEFPQARGCQKNLGFVAQEWCWAEYQQNGGKAATKVLQDLLSVHADIASVKDAADRFMRRLADQLVAQNQFEEALAAVAENKELMKPHTSSKLTRFAYDRWAETFLEKKQWENAVDVYNRGLVKNPRDRHLRNNALAVFDRWAKTHIGRKEWAAAIGVYEKALKTFPRERHLENNLSYCRHQLSQKLSQGD